MKRPPLTRRQRLLAVMLAAFLIVCAYIGLRLVPAVKSLNVLQQAIADTELRLTQTVIPEEPAEDEHKLQREAASLARALATLNTTLEGVEHRLAPPDSQELRLKISDLARLSEVRIRANEPFLNAPLAGTPAAPPAARGRNAKRPRAPAAAPAAPQQLQLLRLPASAGWLARLAPGSEFHRPLQQVSMEGHFEGIRRFIGGLDQLPWQVTVVQLKLEAMAMDPPAGSPQPLTAHLLLAL